MAFGIRVFIFFLRIAGLVLLFLSVGHAYLSEKDALLLHEAAARMEQALISPTITDPPRTDLEEGIVHITGVPTTGEALADPDLVVSVEAVRLIRRVSYYQRKQRVRTKYKIFQERHTVDWFNVPATWHAKDAGSQFSPEGNALLAVVRSAEWAAKDARLGEFALSESVAAKLPGEPVGVTFSPDDETIRKAMLTLLAPVNYAMGRQDLIHVVGDTLYFGVSPESPRLGDVRISFQAVPAETISMIACLQNGILSEIPLRDGGGILPVEKGERSARDLLDAFTQRNAQKTWLRGIVCAVGTVACLAVTRTWLRMLGGIPVLGRLVAMPNLRSLFFLAGLLFFGAIGLARFHWADTPGGGGLVLIIAALFAVSLLRRKRSSEEKSS